MKSVVTAVMAVTAIAFAMPASAVNPNDYLGRWHQPAPAAGCSTVTEPWEATFTLTAYKAGGYYQGGFTVPCAHASGNFGTSPSGPTAQLDGSGIVTISFPAGVRPIS